MHTSDLFALHRRYLAHAGVSFVDASGSALDLASLTGEHVCEISPLVSYAGEGLEAFAAAHPKLSFPIVVAEDTGANPTASKKPKTSYV
jgi:hypothetical protein